MNIQDRRKTLTVEELRRRYNLDALEKDRKAIQLVKNTINKTETEFNKYISIINDSLIEYPDQADENITAWFFDGIPTDERPLLQNKEEHLGDYYYNRESGDSYKYIIENDNYYWKEINDISIKEVLAIASADPDTVDNKRITYLVEPKTPYNIGDIWIKDGIYYRCRAKREDGLYSITDWIKSTEYTNDLFLLDTKAELNQFKINVNKNYVTTASLESDIDSIEAKVTGVYDYTTTVKNEVDDLSQSVNNTIENVTKLEVKVNEISSEISEVADITASADGNGSISIDNVNESEPIFIRVYPTNGQDISLSYPNINSFPSDDSFPEVRKIRFQNKTTNEVFDYELPDDLLYYDEENYDEFIIDYSGRNCIINKKVDYNADGTKYVLPKQEVLRCEYPEILLKSGNYTITVLCFENAYIFARLMAKNIYTDQFPTKIEMNSKIEQTASDITSTVSKKYATKNELSTAESTVKQKIDEIDLKVAKKVDESEYNSAEILLKINNDTSQTVIKSDKLDVDAIATFTNKKLATAGSTTINGSNITSGTIDASKVNVANLNANNIKSGTISGVDIDLSGEIDLQKIKISYKNDPTNYYWANMSYGFLCRYGKSYAGLIPSGAYHGFELSYGDDLTYIDCKGIYTPIVTQTSKKENKKNFELLKSGLDIIKTTDIYKYNLKNQTDGDKKHIGFVIGENYNYSEEITSTKNDGVDLYSMIAVAYKAIQEQQEIIDELKKEIESLKESDR